VSANSTSLCKALCEGSTLRLAPLFASCALVACGSAAPGSGVADAMNPVLLCAERGTDYFRKIRSYPTLRSAPNIGRAAEDVALERCKLSTTTF